MAAAKREFQEETGLSVEGNLLPLGAVKQPGGKTITAWAVEANLDPRLVKSNLFGMEWPPKSGQRQEFPEIDKAAWFTLKEARRRILKGQIRLLDRLAAVLASTERSA